MMQPQFLLVDVGGTFCRFGVSDSHDPRILEHYILRVQDYATFEDALDHYLSLRHHRPVDLRAASIAIAAPVDADVMRLMNSSWQISRQSLMCRYHFDQVEFINDFEALAWSLKSLDTLTWKSVFNQFESVNAIEKNILVVGPGTGLGVAALMNAEGPMGQPLGSVVCASEAGHASYAPIDDVDIELLQYAQRQYARVSVERVLSGAGLTLLYEFFAIRAGQGRLIKTPAEVVAGAETGSDPIAVQAVQKFLENLGSFAGDCALYYGAFGGVFLGGGIAPRLQRLLTESQFIERFCAKGRLASLLERTPVSLITDEHAALRGAMMSLRSKFAQEDRVPVSPARRMIG
jgi:glucokinase